MTEAGFFSSVPNLPEGPTVTIPMETAKPLPARPEEHSQMSMELKVGHKMGTVVDFGKRKGLRQPGKLP
jgi:hypothetical protein